MLNIKQLFLSLRLQFLLRRTSRIQRVVDKICGNPPHIRDIVDDILTHDHAKVSDNNEDDIYIANIVADEPEDIYITYWWYDYNNDKKTEFPLREWTVPKGNRIYKEWKGYSNNNGVIDVSEILKDKTERDKRDENIHCLEKGE